MSRLTFDQDGTRKFETGNDWGVLYPIATVSAAAPTKSEYQTYTSLYQEGVAWNGFTGVTESPSGADETELWADNIKYASFRAAEKFGGTIECYQFPDEFETCNGAVIENGVVVAQQNRTKWGLVYRSIVGNDQDPNAGEKLHIIYGCTTSPSEKAYTTVNESPDAITFSFEFSSVPTAFTATAYAVTAGLKPTCILTIDTTRLTNGKNNANYKKLIDICYGRDADSTANPQVTEIKAQLPTPDDVLAIMGTALG